jgi:hypothetical protein
MNKPTIDNTAAVHQAGATIGTYLAQAINEIDNRLGDGYAAQHPVLLAECVRSQTLDYQTTAFTAAMYECEERLTMICAAIESDVTHSLEGIVNGIEAIASNTVV